MTRSLTLALATAALALFALIPTSAQERVERGVQVRRPTREVERPAQAPPYRGSQAPVVNPITFADSEEVGRTQTQFGRGLHKLGRGALNILTGWLEIPKRIAQVWRDTDPVTGAVVGFFEGLGWGVARTATGFYDVVTFPIPVPANYEPLMEPEFVMPELWGATLPGFAGDR